MDYYQDLMKNYQKVNRYKDELMAVGGFYELPISNFTSMNLAADIVASEKLTRVLDIGANDRRFAKHIPSQCRYYSLDQDESFPHDYRELGDVPNDLKFNMITMFAVIEHIPLELVFNQFIPFFQQHLSEKNYLVISSNNIFHNLGIRTDYSHVKAYSPRDLHAILRNFGFQKVGVYRISLMKSYYRWFFDILSKTVFRPYGIDYAPEICWIYQYVDK